MWFKLVGIRTSRKDKDDGLEEKITLTWQGISKEFMTLTMKFNDEETMSAELGKYGLNPVLGERMELEIKEPKRLEKFEKEESD